MRLVGKVVRCEVSVGVAEDPVATYTLASDERELEPTEPRVRWRATLRLEQAFTALLLEVGERVVLTVHKGVRPEKEDA